ncbi:hypothetical protein RclHR1_00620013 [Rhizophagus clarus]|nr:hypothetical protein RclHR1_00620013 [Rhizophagus clarus]
MLLHATSLIYAQYPEPRYAHASVLFDSKLYFIGGYDSMGQPLSNFFYLDLSTSFSTKDTLKFISINDTGLTPSARCNAVATNNMIYLLGCSMIEDNSSLVYQYSISSDKWKIPSFNTPSPVHRTINSVVIDPSTGRIYYSGGNDDANRPLDDMWILNTNNNQLSWQQVTSAPLPFCCLPTILLPDGYILYIGNNDSMIRYNIKSNEWGLQPTKGGNPIYVQGFSAVLVPDGRIIVYGGTSLFRGFNMSQNDLYVLNTTTYEWSTPEVKNKPITKSFHTACLYENYMIVAFGTSNSDNKPNSEIYLLDITDKTTYKWITDFNLNKSIESGNDHFVIIVGVVVVSSASVLSFIGYKFYKKRNNKQESSKIVIDDFN